MSFGHAIRGILCVCIMWASAKPLQSQPVQWATGDGGNGHWYEAIYKPNKVTWPQSNAEAMGLGGYLATATSAAENQFIFEQVSDPKFWEQSGADYSGPYLGGFQPPGSPEPDGNWQWVTGEPFSHTNWKIGEPNNGDGIEDRLHFLNPSMPGPQWNDTHDGFPRLGFVVEYDTNPVPEPTSVILSMCAIAAAVPYWWRRRRHRA